MTEKECTEPLLLKIIDVAHALNVGRSKAYDLIAHGVIPSIRVGGSRRVPAAALRAWIERQTVKAVNDA